MFENLQGLMRLRRKPEYMYQAPTSVPVDQPIEQSPFDVLAQSPEDAAAGMPPPPQQGGGAIDPGAMEQMSNTLKTNMSLENPSPLDPNALDLGAQKMRLKKKGQLLGDPNGGAV